MTEWLTLVEMLGGVPFATLLLLVLVGGHLKWWSYGWQLNECEARRLRDVSDALAREKEWKDLYRETVSISTNAMEIAQKRSRPSS